MAEWPDYDGEPVVTWVRNEENCQTCGRFKGFFLQPTPQFDAAGAVDDEAVMQEPWVPSDWNGALAIRHRHDPPDIVGGRTDSPLARLALAALLDALAP